jgi:hypothetical protein
MKLIQYIKLILLILIPITLLSLPANFFDNGKSVCLSVMLLDIECYGCGITRAIMHLIHFDLEEALYYNSLSFIVLPILIYTWQDLLRRTIKRLKLKERFIEISKHK